MLNTVASCLVWWFSTHLWLCIVISMSHLQYVTRTRGSCMILYYIMSILGKFRKWKCSRILYDLFFLFIGLKMFLWVPSFACWDLSNQKNWWTSTFHSSTICKRNLAEINITLIPFLTLFVFHACLVRGRIGLVLPSDLILIVHAPISVILTGQRRAKYFIYLFTLLSCSWTNIWSNRVHQCNWHMVCGLCPSWAAPWPGYISCGVQSFILRQEKCHKNWLFHANLFSSKTCSPSFLVRVV